MILSTHSLVGSALVISVASNPWLGLALAAGSHFVLDAIPHWDYKILSLDKTAAQQAGVVKMKFGSDFNLDMLRIGFDFIVGLLFSLFLGISVGVRGTMLIFVLVGGGLGMLPDFLQFVYGRFGGKFLGLIQNFHNWCHTDYRLSNKLGLGIFSQLVIIAIVVAVVFN